MFTDASWHAELLQEVRGASEVLACTMAYDDPSLQQVFLSRLRNRNAFELDLLVDNQYASEGTSRHMRPRLAELARAGAHVWLASGHDHTQIFGTGGRGMRGALHAKAVVLDRSVMYMGSANLTRNSLTNRELVIRTRGPQVRKQCRIALFIFKL